MSQDKCIEDDKCFSNHFDNPLEDYISPHASPPKRRRVEVEASPAENPDGTNEASPRNNNNESLPPEQNESGSSEPTPATPNFIPNFNFGLGSKRTDNLGSASTGNDLVYPQTSSFNANSLHNSFPFTSGLTGLPDLAATNDQTPTPTSSHFPPDTATTLPRSPPRVSHRSNSGSQTDPRRYRKSHNHDPNEKNEPSPITNAFYRPVDNEFPSTSDQFRSSLYIQVNSGSTPTISYINEKLTKPKKSYSSYPAAEVTDTINTPEVNPADTDFTSAIKPYHAANNAGPETTQSPNDFSSEIKYGNLYGNQPSSIMPGSGYISKVYIGDPKSDIEVDISGLKSSIKLGPVVSTSQRSNRPSTGVKQFPSSAYDIGSKNKRNSYQPASSSLSLKPNATATPEDHLTRLKNLAGFTGPSPVSNSYPGDPLTNRQNPGGFKGASLTSYFTPQDPLTQNPGGVGGPSLTTNSYTEDYLTRLQNPGRLAGPSMTSNSTPEVPVSRLKNPDGFTDPSLTSNAMPENYLTRLKTADGVIDPLTPNAMPENYLTRLKTPTVFTDPSLTTNSNPGNQLTHTQNPGGTTSPYMGRINSEIYATTGNANYERNVLLTNPNSGEPHDGTSGTPQQNDKTSSKPSATSIITKNGSVISGNRNRPRSSPASASNVGRRGNTSDDRKNENLRNNQGGSNGPQRNQPNNSQNRDDGNDPRKNPRNNSQNGGDGNDPKKNPQKNSQNGDGNDPEKNPKNNSQNGDGNDPKKNKKNNSKNGDGNDPEKNLKNNSQNGDGNDPSNNQPNNSQQNDENDPEKNKLLLFPTGENLSNPEKEIELNNPEKFAYKRETLSHVHFSPAISGDKYGGSSFGYTGYTGYTYTPQCDPVYMSPFSHTASTTYPCVTYLHSTPGIYSRPYSPCVTSTVDYRNNCDSYGIPPLSPQDPTKTKSNLFKAPPSPTKSLSKPVKKEEFDADGCCYRGVKLIWLFVLAASLMLLHIIYWTRCGIDQIPLWPIKPLVKNLRSFDKTRVAEDTYGLLMTCIYIGGFILVCLCYACCKECGFPSNPKEKCSCKEIKLFMHLSYGVMLVIYLFILQWIRRSPSNVKTLLDGEGMDDCMTLCLFYTLFILVLGVIAFVIYSLERQRMRKFIKKVRSRKVGPAPSKSTLKVSPASQPASKQISVVQPQLQPQRVSTIDNTNAESKRGYMNAPTFGPYGGPPEPPGYRYVSCYTRSNCSSYGLNRTSRYINNNLNCSDRR